MKDAEE